MKLFGVFCLSLLSVQDKKYECSLRKVEVKGAGSQWTLEVTLEHTFPSQSIFNVVVKMKRHVYLWQSKDLVFGTDPQQFPIPAILPSSGKTARTHSPISVATAGMYEVVFYFDPNAQTSVESVKKSMGKAHFYRHEFPAVTLTVGEPKKLLSALREDTDECVKLIKKTFEFMDKIEKQSDDKDWLDKAEKLFEEVNKLKMKADEQTEKSLHNATYRVIKEVLDELVLVGRQIKLLKSAGSGVGGGGGGGGGDDPPTGHPDEGSDAPILPGLDGKLLSLDKMREHIRQSDVVRMREYFSWLTLVHQQARERLEEAHAVAKKDAQAAKAVPKLRSEANEANEEAQRAYKHLIDDAKQKEAFEALTTYVLEEKDQRYADFFDVFKNYVSAIASDAEKTGEIPQSVRDAQKLVKDHLETAQAKAWRGKK